MVVMVLEKVPKSLRGELTRWMLEVGSGVFAGSMSAMVRELLWDKCIHKSQAGRCCLLYRSSSEQGFTVRMHGDSKRSVTSFDGLNLITLKNAKWERMMVEPDGSAGNHDNEA